MGERLWWLARRPDGSPVQAVGWDPRYPDMANAEFDDVYLGARIC